MSCYAIAKFKKNEFMELISNFMNSNNNDTTPRANQIQFNPTKQA